MELPVGAASHQRKSLCVALHRHDTGLMQATYLIPQGVPRATPFRKLGWHRVTDTANVMSWIAVRHKAQPQSQS